MSFKNNKQSSEIVWKVQLCSIAPSIFRGEKNKHLKTNLLLLNKKIFLALSAAAEREFSFLFSVIVFFKFHPFTMKRVVGGGTQGKEGWTLCGRRLALAMNKC